VDLDKIRVKLQRMRDELRLLHEIKSRSEAEFRSEPLVQRAATHMLQVAVEAMVDVGNHIIAREGLGVPHTYRDTVEILLEHGVLPSDHKDTFVNMIRFRNRVVHLDDEVDPSEVYRIIQERLSDFDRFIEAIVRRYFTQKPEGPV
jgi:Uncharacterized conserved protein